MINIGILEDDLDYRNDFVQYCRNTKKLSCSLILETTEQLKKYSSGLKDLDLMLIDLELPGLNGLSAIKHIKKTSPDTPVIVLSSSQEYHAIFKALKNGAIGYMIKNMAYSEIEEYLLDFHFKNKIPLSPQIARRILKYFQASPKISKLERENVTLSAQKISIIKYLIKGLKVKDIASLMNLTENGVKYHIKNIYKKLHIKSRQELMGLHVERFFNKYFGW